MLIHLVVPTKNRLEKLIKCLGSITEARKQIEKEHNIYIFVYFSVKEEYEGVDKLLGRYPFIFTRLMKEEYNVGTFWNNHVKEISFDILFYLNDDILLSPLCLKEAIDSMNIRYPNLDGIIGLNQENIPKNQALSTAFGAVGIEYVNKFPNKEFFCPEYSRFFSDQEIELFSKSINKLHWEEKAKLIHLHPSFCKKAEDDTHRDVRRYWKKDKETFDKRRNLGYLWGKNFNLIKNEI